MKANTLSLLLVILCMMTSGLSLYDPKPFHSIPVHKPSSQHLYEFRYIYLMPQQEKLFYYSIRYPEDLSMKEALLNVIDFNGVSQCPGASYNIYDAYMEYRYPMKKGIAVLSPYQAFWLQSCNQTTFLFNFTDGSQIYKRGYYSGAKGDYFLWRYESDTYSSIFSFNATNNKTILLFAFDKNQPIYRAIYNQNHSQIIYSSTIPNQQAYKTTIKSLSEHTKQDITITNQYLPFYANSQGYVGWSTNSQQRVAFVNREGQASVIYSEQDRRQALSTRVCGKEEVLVVVIGNQEVNKTVVQVYDLKGNLMQNFTIDVLPWNMKYFFPGDQSGLDCYGEYMTILGYDGRARIFKFTDYIPDPKPTPDNSDGFPVWAGILVGLLVGIIIGFVGAKLFSKLRGSKSNQSQGDYERLTKERNDIIKASLKD